MIKCQVRLTVTLTLTELYSNLRKYKHNTENVN